MEMSSDYPWEPPLAGDEAERLVGALERLRATFRWKADDLDAARLRARIVMSTLTIGALLKHLAVVEAGTTRSNVHAPGSRQRWRTVGSTSRCTRPGPTAGTRTCAGSSAT